MIDYVIQIGDITLTRSDIRQFYSKFDSQTNCVDSTKGEKYE